MRQFEAKGLRIFHLSREAKVIYSFFCGLSLLAMLSSLLLYEDLVGPSLGGQHLRRIGDYYATQSAAPSSSPSAPAGPPAAASGPAIALPTDEPLAVSEPASPGPQRLTITVPYRKLLEVTHFHLFTVPVFLLILTHLFLLTGVSRRAQSLWIWLGWLSASLHIATPWLVRAFGRGSAWLHAVSGLSFFVASLVLCLLPLWQMWSPPAGRAGGRTGSQRRRPTPSDAAAARSATGDEGRDDPEADLLDSPHASRVDTQ
jgi:hypothetical protein